MKRVILGEHEATVKATIIVLSLFMEAFLGPKLAPAATDPSPPTIRRQLTAFLEAHKGELQQVSLHLDDGTVKSWGRHRGVSFKNIAELHSGKAMLIAGTIVSWWLGSAYMAVGARAIFPHVFRFLYGDIPPSITPRYWFVYRPLLEHVVAFSYDHSTAISLTAYGGALAGYHLMRAGLHLGHRGSKRVLQGLATLVAAAKATAEVKTLAPGESSDVSADVSADVSEEDYAEACDFDPLVLFTWGR